MTHDELITKAVAKAKRAGITEELLRPRVREAAVIYFDTRGPDAGTRSSWICTPASSSARRSVTQGFPGRMTTPP